MSNDQYIANINKKLDNMCDTHKHILSDYLSKHCTMISICAKEWEHQFEQNMYKIHNQQLEQIEKVMSLFMKKIYNQLKYAKINM